jgi:hypothetical protein
MAIAPVVGALVATASAGAVVVNHREDCGMPKARRLVMVDPNNQPLTMFDISDIDNANNEYTLQFVVQTQCDLLHWHDDSRTDIPPYGERITSARVGKRGYPHNQNTGGDALT